MYYFISRIYIQMQIYFDIILFKQKCGFRKGYNLQHCLISRMEERCGTVDKCDASGAFLTNLSKAFDYLPRQFSIAKLHTYGFDKKSLNLIHDYLSHRKQRVKANKIYSS